MSEGLVMTKHCAKTNIKNRKAFEAGFIKAMLHYFNQTASANPIMNDRLAAERLANEHLQLFYKSQSLE